MQALLFVACSLVPAQSPDAEGPVPPDAQFRLGTLRLAHHAPLSSLAFAPDGKTLASADKEGHIRTWDVATSRRLLDLPKGTGVTVLYTPDGKHLATCGDGPVAFRNPADGAPLFLLGDTRGPASAFSPDGKFLITSGGGRSVRMWEMATRFVVRKFEGMREGIRAVTFSPDGKTVAATGKEAIMAWETASGKETLRLLDREAEGAWSLAFSPDGKSLAAATTTQVALWETTKGKLQRRFERGSLAVLFAPEGRLVAGGDLSVWDFATGQQVRNHRLPDPGVSCMALAPGGRMLATAGGDDGVIRLWDLATGQLLSRPRGHHDEVRAVACSPDGRWAATASGGDHTVRLWDLATGNPTRVLPINCGFPNKMCRSSEATGLAFSADSRRLATGSILHLHVWDVGTGQELHRLADNEPGHRLRFIDQLNFMPDGRGVITAGSDLYVHFWDLEKGKIVRRLQPGAGRAGVEYRIPGLALSPDGKTLATGGSDGLVPEGEAHAATIQLWSLETGKVVKSFRRQPDVPRFLTFSPDGRFLAASGAWDKPPEVWSLASGKEARLLTGHEESRHWSETNPIAISPDGQLLVTGGKENTVVLWEAATGQAVRVLRGHVRPVRSLAFTPDGQSILSGSADTTAMLWPVWPRNIAAKNWDDKDAGKLWDALKGDTKAAYPALWQLALSPAKAVALVKARLGPEGDDGPMRIAQLIAQLDDEQFTAREEASRLLAQLGSRAKAALEKATKSPSIEVRRRAEDILARLDTAVVEVSAVREMRAIQVLERIATPDARALLETLARGNPDSSRTQAARGALQRIKAYRK